MKYPPSFDSNANLFDLGTRTNFSQKTAQFFVLASSFDLGNYRVSIWFNDVAELWLSNCVKGR